MSTTKNHLKAINVNIDELRLCLNKCSTELNYLIFIQDSSNFVQLCNGSLILMLRFAELGTELSKMYEKIKLASQQLEINPNHAKVFIKMIKDAQSNLTVLHNSLAHLRLSIEINQKS